MSCNGTVAGRVLAWLHIGDLHLAEAGAENHRHLGRIVALADTLPPGSLDFAVLPGDNADDGTAEQFQLVRDAVAPLRLPLHILPDDYDVKQHSLDAHYAMLGALLARPQVLGVDTGHRNLQGRRDEDAVAPARPGWTSPGRSTDGSDRDRVGAWPERGILDTQLGPNRNGKKW